MNIDDYLRELEGLDLSSTETKICTTLLENSEILNDIKGQ